MIFLLFFIYFESKKAKNYIFMNFSLSFGLLNLPDATNGRFFFENLIMAGILKAANLSTRNSFKVSFRQTFVTCYFNFIWSIYYNTSFILDA